MANQSIYNAFEQMWTHTKAKLNGKMDKMSIDATPTALSENLIYSFAVRDSIVELNRTLTLNMEEIENELNNKINTKMDMTGGTARWYLGNGTASGITVEMRRIGDAGNYTFGIYVKKADGTQSYLNLINADGSRGWAPSSHNHDSVYLKLTGGNLSGSISVVKSDATVAQFHAKNSLRQGSLYVSEVGNLGVYDRTNSEWVIRSDTSKNIHFGQQIAGTMWGPGVSSSWYNGRDKAKLRVTSQNGYSPALSLKTKKGSWDIGSYSGSINSGYGNAEGSGTSNWLLFNFLPDANYTNALNAPLGRICFSENGMIWSYAYYISTDGTDNLASVTEFGIDTFEDTYEIIESQAEGVIVGKTIFGPYSTKTYNLGNSNYRWKQLYATTTTINTSDRNLKKDFRTFDSDDRYTQFFMDLKPMIFKMKDGESGRDHFGFIAQDVEDSLLNLGYTSLDFAGLCKDAKCIPQQKPTKEERRNKKFKFQEELPLDLDENGNVQYEYSLRYQEFISLNTYMIQKLYNKIESLENEIKLLKKG